MNMPILAIHSKETKKLLYEIEISDEVFQKLKKQKDPSKTFEDAVTKWVENEK